MPIASCKLFGRPIRQPSPAVKGLQEHVNSANGGRSGKSVHLAGKIGFAICLGPDVPNTRCPLTGRYYARDVISTLYSRITNFSFTKDVTTLSPDPPINRRRQTAWTKFSRV